MRHLGVQQTGPLLPVALLVLLAACAPAAAPAPTSAPAPTAAPAKPTAAAAVPAATAAPAAKPAEAKPAPSTGSGQALSKAEGPAASPAAQPAASPVAKPAEAKPAASPAAQPAKPADTFYAGKAIRFLVGYPPAGNYDVWARVLARHLPRYIPGNPTMVVENMAGAGSMVAANHLFNNAPKDGTVIATFGSGMLGNQLLGVQGIEYDIQKFTWLGAISEPSTICIATEDSGVKSFEDLLPPKRTRANFGSSGPGSVGHDFPVLFNALLNANINIVSGYAGNGPVRTAIERKELDGYCLVWGAAKTQHRPWIDAGQPKFQNLVQIGLKNNPELAGVPNAFDFIKSEDDRAVMKLLAGQVDFFFPFAAPPGIPADRTAVLRKAMADVVKDAELAADAKKSALDTIPMSADQLEQLINDLMSTPAPVKQRFKDLLGKS
jgi:tripartite-type tricarboxylate transporter receptor subunit TctC